MINKLDNKINDLDKPVNIWILLNIIMKTNELDNVLYILDQYK